MRAITGAEPVPVPPPIPAVTNTISASASTSRRRSSSSSAALRPISGLPPVPRPRVSICPICSRIGARVVLQRLSVGIDRDEIDVAQSRRDHVIDRVAAASARADHLDPRARIGILNQLNHFTDSSSTPIARIRRAARSSASSRSSPLRGSKEIPHPIGYPRAEPSPASVARKSVAIAALRSPHGAAGRPRSCTSVSSALRAFPSD